MLGMIYQGEQMDTIKQWIDDSYIHGQSVFNLLSNSYGSFHHWVLNLCILF